MDEFFKERQDVRKKLLKYSRAMSRGEPLDEALELSSDEILRRRVRRRGPVLEDFEKDYEEGGAGGNIYLKEDLINVRLEEREPLRLRILKHFKLVKKNKPQLKKLTAKKPSPATAKSPATARPRPAIAPATQAAKPATPAPAASTSAPAAQAPAPRQAKRNIRQILLGQPSQGLNSGGGEVGAATPASRGGSGARGGTAGESGGGVAATARGGQGVRGGVVGKASGRGELASTGVVSRGLAATPGSASAKFFAALRDPASLPGSGASSGTATVGRGELASAKSGNEDAPGRPAGARVGGDVAVESGGEGTNAALGSGVAGPGEPASTGVADAVAGRGLAAAPGSASAKFFAALRDPAALPGPGAGSGTVVESGGGGGAAGKASGRGELAGTKSGNEGAAGRPAGARVGGDVAEVSGGAAGRNRGVATSAKPGRAAEAVAGAKPLLARGEKSRLVAGAVAREAGPGAKLEARPGAQLVARDEVARDELAGSGVAEQGRAAEAVGRAESREALLGGLAAARQNLGANQLLFAGLFLGATLVLFFPTVYIRSHIYYLSREVAALRTQEALLGEEGRELAKRLENLRFKNQILDYLE